MATQTMVIGPVAMRYEAELAQSRAEYFRTMEAIKTRKWAELAASDFGDFEALRDIHARESAAQREAADVWSAEQDAAKSRYVEDSGK